jgi:DNA-binding transcriptional LysR family regulator
MFDYFAILYSKQIVERSWSGREISLRQHKYKISVSQETTGVLPLPPSFGVLHIAPLLPEFLASYSEVSIDLHLSDATVDLVGEGFDAAIRIAVLPDSSHVVRRLCEIPRYLVGSPTYLNKHGRPRHPLHLAQHRCLGYSYAMAAETWRFTTDGKSATVRPEALRWSSCWRPWHWRQSARASRSPGDHRFDQLAIWSSAHSAAPRLVAGRPGAAIGTTWCGARSPRSGGLPMTAIFGPFVAGLDPIERIAQLRSLAMLVAVFTGSRNPLITTLREAEGDDAAAVRALELLDRMPSLTRRRLLSTFGAITWPPPKPRGRS